MSNLNKFEYNFVHLVCNELLKRPPNFVKNIIFSGVINYWILITISPLLIWR